MPQGRRHIVSRDANGGGSSRDANGIIFQRSIAAKIGEGIPAVKKKIA